MRGDWPDSLDGTAGSDTAVADHSAATRAGLMLVARMFHGLGPSYRGETSRMTTAAILARAAGQDQA